MKRVLVGIVIVYGIAIAMIGMAGYIDHLLTKHP